MTGSTPVTCDDVQMAVLARLDGEATALSQENVEMHLTSCDACQAAVAELTALHAKLDRVDSGQLDMDLWPAVRSRLVATSPSSLRREREALMGLAVVLGAWRLAQLLLEMPAPVLNSVVPLALLTLVIWRYTGDPFAIRVTTFQLEEEGAS